MSQLADNISRSTATIQAKCPDFTPEFAIVLGSGLGPLADEIEDAVSFSYADLPGFPQSSVAGHAGRLVLGTLAGAKVACLQGRVHYYEGTDPVAVKTMFYTMKAIGCQTYLGTNASGSLRENVVPGELVMINDHINFQGTNPLVGPNDEQFGPRFVGLDDTYDPQLQQQLHHAAKTCGITLHEGVYVSVLGPVFETPAEIRMFKVWGADVVGMSTVPEVIVAKHCGLKIAVVAAITNFAAGMHPETLSHEVTLAGAKKGVGKLANLIKTFLQQASA